MSHMINDYLIYATLAITITAIPGPAVVLTIKNSIKYGYKHAIANIFGNCFAMILLATISALGLGAVILKSSTLFTIIKLCGCLYLCYLGIKIWKEPSATDQILHQSKTRKEKKQVVAIFKEGFAVGLSNPKAIAFFTALFPQFIDPQRTFFSQFLTLILTIEGISFIVLTTYAILSSAAAPYLSRKQQMSIFNKATATAFIGFALALIYEK